MATSRPTTATGAEVPDDWESIRYVFYVTVGWLVATALAVVVLLTVAPAWF